LVRIYRTKYENQVNLVDSKIAKVEAMNEQVNQFLAEATQSIQAGQFQTALELANQAISLDNSNSEAYLIRGIALSQTGQPDAATDAFQESLRLNPSNPKGYFNLAVHYYQQGKKDLSLEATRQAMNLDPSHTGARELAARIEQELGLQTSPPVGSPNVGSQTQENPYTQNPYGQNPYGAEYKRSDSEYYATQQNSIQFVENMGQNWVTLGYIIVLIGAINCVVSIFTMGPMINELMQNANNPNFNPESVAFRTNPIMQLLGYAGALGSLLWICMDLANRRGQWLWLLPYIISCCCGLQWLVQLIYMLTGRK
jgi:hypothetical protein